MASELFETSVMEIPESRDPSANNTSTAREPHIERFSFAGTGKEYFGIWIVNILLTIVTLGIYSAWAKVRNNQYFYGNTLLDNSSFEYTATPMQILRGRIVAVILLALFLYAQSYVPSLALVLVLVFILGSPWIIMKSLAFNAYHSEYRGIKFHFHQNLWDAAKTYLLLPIVAFLPAVVFFGLVELVRPSLGIEPSISQSIMTASLTILALLALYLAYPFIMYVSHRYIINNHAFGNEDFRLRIDSPKSHFSIYLKAFVLFILVLIGFVIVAALLVSLLSGLGSVLSGDFNQVGGAMIPLIIGIYLLGALMYAFLFAYVKAKTYNLIHQRTAIGKHKLRAKLKIMDLAMLYITNTIGVILTLGLFIPWAKVRTAQLLANNTAVQVYGDLSSFAATQAEYQNALGEEMGEVFDLDIGL